MLNRLKQIAWGALFGALVATQAIFPVWAQTATLLPNARQQFFTPSGIPAAAGTVDFFIPSTNTRKTTWVTSTESTGTQNTNPVHLDSGGFATIYGDGCYRQVVKDMDGNTIWDLPTCSTGSGGGGGSGAFSEGVMVGAIIAWANPVLPGKYLYTAGQAILRTSFPDLFTAITFQQIILCSIGVSTITVPTNVSDKIPIGAPIETSCFAPGTTVTSKASGLLTMSNPATATTSVSSILFPWGNGNGSTTFNVPDLRGRTLAGPDNMLGSVASRLTSTYYGSNPDAINAVGGNESGTLATGNLPPYTPTGTIISTSTAILLQQDVYTLSPGPTTLYGQSGSTSANQTPTITSTFTGVAQGGTSTPVSKIQPTLTADYIIKALPDDLPSGPGVTSIQGMTGAIFCGVGFVCTAQTLSFALGSGADYLAGTSGKITEDGVIYQAETTTPYGTTTTFDFRTFINTKVTLTGDITTQTLVGVMAGKAGSIAYIQDGAGGHTTVWNPIFKFGGGVTPTLSTAAGAIDILSYDCRTTTFCTSSLLQDVK